MRSAGAAARNPVQLRQSSQTPRSRTVRSQIATDSGGHAALGIPFHRSLLIFQVLYLLHLYGNLACPYPASGQKGLANPTWMESQTSSKSELALRVIKNLSFPPSVPVPTPALLSPPLCYQLSPRGFGRRHDSQQQQLARRRRIHPSLFRTAVLLPLWNHYLRLTAGGYFPGFFK